MGFNWWREAEPVDEQEIVDRYRPSGEPSADGSRSTAPGPLTLAGGRWPHETPDQPLSVPEAHWTMQRHRRRQVQSCPRKPAARQALIDAGRMKSDTSREY
ncbi:hypothetical protein AB4305_19820 [Nocardia sp. 2YAB30]|uniref:hypothetical protein n=1 Tax=unclassified Nocardia TaxID=2637762 RepID=UPI003F95CFDA